MGVTKLGVWMETSMGMEMETDIYGRLGLVGWGWREPGRLQLKQAVRVEDVDAVPDPRGEVVLAANTVQPKPQSHSNHIAIT